MIQYSKTYNVFTIAFRANLARGANLDQNDEVRKNFRTSIIIFYAIYWLHFFVWRSQLGERTPNENDVAVLQRQISLMASQIETRGNLNTTPTIFIFRMMAIFCRKSSQLISRRIK